MGGGGLGGCVFSRVGGSKALDPHPSYNSEGFLSWAPATPSFFGHRSLVWLFAGAPFCCVVVQVAGVQVAIFHIADFFLRQAVSQTVSRASRQAERKAQYGFFQWQTWLQAVGTASDVTSSNGRTVMHLTVDVWVGGSIPCRPPAALS